MNFSAESSKVNLLSKGQRNILRVPDRLLRPSVVVQSTSKSVRIVRFRLFSSLNVRRLVSCLRFGLNSYVYAPKDDVKHRSRWRDLYSGEESKELSRLIDAAKQHGIRFIYALSPGLDLIYSGEKDLHALQRKFDQVCSFLLRRRRRRRNV